MQVCLIAYLQEIIGESLTDHLVRKVDEALLKTFLMQDPNTRYCPEPDCKWAVTIEMENSKGGGGRSSSRGCPVLCQMCDKQFCVQCRRSWHDGPCGPPDALETEYVSVGDMNIICM